MALNRQSKESRNIHQESGYAAAAILPVCERQRAAMGFRDLATQDQTDSRASGLGGEKWHEQIRGVRESWAIVNDRKLNLRLLERPPNYDFPISFEHRLRSIADQIDQQLLQLVSVRLNCDRRAFNQPYRRARFDSPDALYQFAKFEWGQRL